MSSGTVRGGRQTRRLSRTALSSLALLVAASLVGCSAAGSAEAPPARQSGAGGSGLGGGANASAGTPSGVAGSTPMLLLPTPTPACEVPVVGTPVFASRAISNDAPARLEFYTWTTAEQVHELRAGSVLMTRTEREGLGPGYAMEVLAAMASSTATDPQQAEPIALAALLSGPSFAKARYAWPEPWATRVGWPDETYGDQLVRMVLRPEAWLARYRQRVLDVVDINNAPVPLAEVLAHPERLAGVFFVKDSGAGGPQCGGSFRGGNDGYREFIIGNESMIEEWSLGTSQIRARIESDIALITAFFERIRVCPVRDDPNTWNTDVVCGWSGTPALSELGSYQGALAIPSPGYLPAPLPLATLIETLEASLFEPDPFLVHPSQ